MSKKVAVLSVSACVLSLAALGVGGMAWVQAWMNQPIEEPVAWRGPIVMNTQEELRRAFSELKDGSFIRS